ncbi:MAG: gliding motility-associated C-terminal domain-containing protein [Bacteroidota bacterium]
MNIFVTKSGLTYLFVENKKEETEEDRLHISNKGKSARLEPEKVETQMAWVNITLQGAQIKEENISKEGESFEHFNFLGNQSQSAIYDVHQFSKVIIREVYPGIDWVLYDSRKCGMKYDFIVHPGADPSQIQLLYEGDKPLKVNKDGSVSVRTRLDSLTENKPYSYDWETSTEVKSEYKLRVLSKHQSLLCFTLGDYNRKSTLIIDPQLVWGTFFAGNGFEGPCAITTDSIGNIFIAGYLSGTTNFPVQNYPGSYFLSFSSDPCSFVAKFSATGILLWSTYFFDVSYGRINAVAVDATGNLYMVGWGTNLSLPLQNLPGAYNQAAYGGGNMDAFITKFSNNGTLLWSTFFGGSSDEWADNVAIDAFGNIFFTGITTSVNFPLQNLPGAFNQPIQGDTAAFIVKLNPAGNLIWSTALGVGGNVARMLLHIDNNNNLYAAGITTSNNLSVLNPGSAFIQSVYGGNGDVFIFKFNVAGNLLWTTYYGGSGTDIADAIATDAMGNLYLAGSTSSVDFPIQNLAGAFNQPVYGGIQDIFLIKFDPLGSRLWATFHGGSGIDVADGINNNLVIDHCNNVYLSFITSSSDIGTVSYQSSCQGFNDSIYSGFNNEYDGFLVVFTPSGQKLWSTYYGGEGSNPRSIIALDEKDNLVVAGEWAFISNIGTYPILDPGGGAYFDPTFEAGEDCFILKFSPIQVSLLPTQVNPVSCGACDGVLEVSLTCSNGPYTFQWSNGVIESNIDSAISTITGLCPGNYSVRVISSCNLDTTLSFILPGNLPINLSVSSQASSCNFPNGTATVNATGGSGNYAYTWSNGATGIFNTSLAEGSYTVTATDQNGCSAQAQVNVAAIPPVNVLVTASDTLIQYGDSVNLSAQNGVDYNWTPATGLSCINCSTPIAKPLKNTTYFVTGKDTNGCAYSRSVTIVVEIICNELFVPDIFSPNGMGNPENEKLCVYSNCIKEMTFGIYNRWGDLIYLTNDFNGCWDGTHKGSEASTGTYVYRLYVEQLDGQKFERSGNITLVR